MSVINVEEVKKLLREFARTYRRPLHGKMLVLEPFKDDLLKLDAKNIPTADIAAFLSQKCGITVSKDTVQRFLRTVKKIDRSSRATKASPPPPVASKSAS
jgi:hypothetical protein